VENNDGTIEDDNDHDEDDETNLEVHEGDDAGGAGPVGARQAVHQHRLPQVYLGVEEVLAEVEEVVGEVEEVVVVVKVELVGEKEVKPSD